MKGSKNLLSLGATAALAAAAAVNATPPHTVGSISKNPPKNWLLIYFCISLTNFSMEVSAD